MKYLFLVLSIAFNVTSYLVYKSISTRAASPAWVCMFSLGMILGAVNVFFFTRALRQIQLNVAYPIFSGACIFTIALLSHFLFGEKVSALNMAGAFLVAAGILLLTR